MLRLLRDLVPPSAERAVVTTVDVYTLEKRVVALPQQETPAAIWLLDLDGVINVIAKKPRDGWGDYAYTAARADTGGIAFKICYSPTFVRLLNLLHAKNVVSFGYLTTWEDAGHRQFAPAVGLDVGRWVAGFDYAAGTSWWKLLAAKKLAGSTDATGELLIWTDDDIKHQVEPEEMPELLPRDRSIVICPDETKGLTPEEFESILRAIEDRL